MNWIWVLIPAIAIAAPFTYMIASQWMNYRVKMAKAEGTSDFRRRLAEAEEALAATEQRLEKLEAVVVDQLLDAPAEPVSIEAGRRQKQTIA